METFGPIVILVIAIYVSYRLCKYKEWVINNPRPPDPWYKRIIAVSLVVLITYANITYLSWSGYDLDRIWWIRLIHGLY